MALIRDHWFRANDGSEGLCVYAGCGKLPRDHVEGCGEWTDPEHLYRPWAGRCLRCGRHWAHSTHWGLTKKNRTLSLWPRLQHRVHRIKDAVVRRRTCHHFSHRLRLPCWRQMTSTCRGTCDKHYDCEACE